MNKNALKNYTYNRAKQKIPWKNRISNHQHKMLKKKLRKCVKNVEEKTSFRKKHKKNFNIEKELLKEVVSLYIIYTCNVYQKE